jgi:hypothetical protein
MGRFAENQSSRQKNSLQNSLRQGIRKEREIGSTGRFPGERLSAQHALAAVIAAGIARLTIAESGDDR